MSGAASHEDQPDDVVAVESDPTGPKVFDIEPESADAAKRRRYTRSEVNERIDRIAESLGKRDPLMQQLTKNAVSPALTNVLAQNASMMKFATAFMGSSPAMTALAGMTRPYDKIAKAFGPNIPLGVDWASIVPTVPVKFAETMLGASLTPSIAKGLGVFDGVAAINGLGGTSSPFAKAQDEREERFAGRFTGALPAPSWSAGRSPVDLAMPDLPPNPVHETNERIGELVEILRAEREDHLRDQQRGDEALAEQKRKNAQDQAKNAQDRALLRISEKRRRAEAWKGWAGLAAGLVGAAAGVLALFH